MFEQFLGCHWNYHSSGGPKTKHLTGTGCADGNVQGEPLPEVSDHGVNAVADHDGAQPLIDRARQHALVQLEHEMLFSHHRIMPQLQAGLYME